MTCESCSGTGWVCERCGTTWEREDGTTCCGAGQPCDCNPDAHYEFAAVHATTEPEAVKAWVQ
jgi:hypothetical protein